MIENDGLEVGHTPQALIDDLVLQPGALHLSVSSKGGGEGI